MKKLSLTLIMAGITILTACNDSEKKVATEASPAAMEMETKAESTEEIAQNYTVGDRVPHELVCMVNDAYMGRFQIEVPHEGKMYYGCCEMCVKRIPEDPAVRVTEDPHTGEKVDKAEAYIVIAGPQGQVMYFANEENYGEFLKSRGNS